MCKEQSRYPARAFYPISFVEGEGLGFTCGISRSDARSRRNFVSSCWVDLFLADVGLELLGSRSLKNFVNSCCVDLLRLLVAVVWEGSVDALWVGFLLKYLVILGC